jgi:hypothetical protein
MIECDRCKLIKLESEFYRNKSSRTGRQNYCVVCFRKAQKESYARVGRVKSKQHIQELLQDPDLATHYRRRQAAALRRYRVRHGLETRARWAINHMLTRINAAISKSSSCDYCHQEIPLEAHHYKGYEPENWLNVHWLCHDCHQATRQPNYKERRLTVIDLDVGASNVTSDSYL